MKKKKLLLRVGESNPALPRSIWIEESPLTGGYTDRYTNAELDIRGGNYYKYNVLITCTND